MHDADSRRHHLEGVERLHAPFQKLVALPVAPKLHFQVALQSVRHARKVHLHGMVHHQIDWHERLNEPGIPAQARHRRTHRRQIHEQRHSGEVLQHDARDDERDFRGALGPRLPVRQFLYVAFRHFVPVAITEDGFQHQSNRNGQSGNRADARLFHSSSRVYAHGRLMRASVYARRTGAQVAAQVADHG